MKYITEDTNKIVIKENSEIIGSAALIDNNECHRLVLNIDKISNVKINIIDIYFNEKYLGKYKIRYDKFQIVNNYIIIKKAILNLLGGK